MPKKDRTYMYVRDVMAGCFECYGSDAHWYGPSAQGTAARHFDATGHKTWADVALSITYMSKEDAQERQEEKDRASK